MPGRSWWSPKVESIGNPTRLWDSAELKLASSYYAAVRYLDILLLLPEDLEIERQ